MRTSGLGLSSLTPPPPPLPFTSLSPSLSSRWSFSPAVPDTPASSSLFLSLSVYLQFFGVAKQQRARSKFLEYESAPFNRSLFDVAAGWGGCGCQVVRDKRQLPELSVASRQIKSSKMRFAWRGLSGMFIQRRINQKQHYISMSASETGRCSF